MATGKLQILSLPVAEQAYSCHSCADCCRSFAIPLMEDDLEKIRRQNWQAKLRRPVTIAFRGATYLAQKDDGSCVFLMEDDRCRIHAEHGLTEKPLACQLYPFHLTPTSEGGAMGLNFACPSVMESKGAALPAHLDNLKRLAGQLPQLAAAPRPPHFNHQRRATSGELKALTSSMDGWLAHRGHGVQTRLDGIAWIIQSLAQARLDAVRDERFGELLALLFGALPGELDRLPIEPATKRQRKMLRQSVFARAEEVKLHQIAARRRLPTVLGQLRRSRRFGAGRGLAPRLGGDWPTAVALEAVEEVRGADDAAEAEAIDELITRYLRCCLLGARYWGAGYYGWPVVAGLTALLVNVAAAGWLARLFAAGEGRDSIGPADVRRALARVDRHAGRAPWLGSASERLRLRYLQQDDGLRRLLTTYALIRRPATYAQGAGKAPS